MYVILISSWKNPTLHLYILDMEASTWEVIRRRGWGSGQTKNLDGNKDKGGETQPRLSQGFSSIMKKTKLILIYRESTPTILDSITLATVFPQKRPRLMDTREKSQTQARLSFTKGPKQLTSKHLKRLTGGIKEAWQMYFDDNNDTSIIKFIILG